MRTLLLSFLIVASAVAQTPAEEDKTPKSAKEETTTDNAFIIACDAQPGKMLVLDSRGKWMSGVRSVEIKFEIGGQGTVTCTMYDGPIKPTKPQVKTWKLAQLKTIPAADFQQLIDNLQTDPDAIKMLLK